MARKKRNIFESATRYYTKQLDAAWDRIDFLNKYITDLCEQIRAMGGTPVEPQIKEGR